MPTQTGTESVVVPTHTGTESVEQPEEDVKADLSDSASEEKSPEKEEDAFEPPDEELVKKIVDQVEFYFSDVNITKDAFLLKHVKRNKEGYVSLKLISSFKRVKHLAKDWRVVAYALAKSEKLEINEAETKLRRKEPLPPYDQTAPSRTIVAIDLPFEKPTIESVAEMFGPCGEIALIRVLRPGNPVPADVRNFYNRHPEMNGAVSALVEFVRTESAHNAVQKEWLKKNGEKVKVLELNAPAPVEKKKKLKKSGRSFDSDYSSCQSGSEIDEWRIRRRCSSPHGDHWAQRRWSRDSDSSCSYTRSRSNSGVFFPSERLRRMSSDSGTDSYSSRSRSNSGVSISDVRRFSVGSGKESECCCCHGGRRGSSGSEGYGSSRSRCDSGASDMRRNSVEYYCARERRECRRMSSSKEPEPKLRENVVRLPRGPDGGRGFLPCHTLVE